jgi:hypothetical protein
LRALTQLSHPFVSLAQIDRVLLQTRMVHSQNDNLRCAGGNESQRQ